MPKSSWLALLTVAALMGCSAATASSSPEVGSSSSPVATASAESTDPLLPIATPSGSVTPSGSATRLGQLPVRGSADDIGPQVRMAPASDGSLYVSIPDAGGTVITRVLSTGASAAGWPIFLDGATPCGLLVPAADGSVRVVCSFPIEGYGEGAVPERAFAFAADGRPLDGWPVDIPGQYGFVGRVIGSDLVLFFEELLASEFQPGQPMPGHAWVATIARDGTVRNGSQVPLGLQCCNGRAAIGPTGVAYAVFHDFGAAEESPKTSSLTAVGADGAVGGFPVSMAGLASVPAFDASGRLQQTVETVPGGSARIVVLDAAGRIVGGGADLPGFHATGDADVIGGPSVIPLPPLIGSDGSRFVIGTIEFDTAFAGVSANGSTLPGWPYITATPRQQIESCPATAACDGSALTAPALGPGNVVFLPLSAADGSHGGSLTAIGLDGRVRPGWPVVLSRPGAGFWSVVVGDDGSVYALAVEPEANDDTSSATILALAPDGSKLYATTIIQPLGD